MKWIIKLIKKLLGIKDKKPVAPEAGTGSFIYKKQEKKKPNYPPTWNAPYRKR